MKVVLNQRINTVYKRQPNIAFCAKPPEESSMDKFVSKTQDEMEGLKKAKDLFVNLNDVFCTDINSEKQGNPIGKIPNCLMFEIQKDGDEIFPIEWLKKTADCNFVHLSDSNNDALMDNLDGALKKSKNTFEQTKRRTLIHVEGFDRLITKGQNSFETIDSLKDYMNRCAKDFGATIVFSTTDKSKLTSEAIEPHRTTRIEVKNLKTDLENYNAFLESRGYFKDYGKRIAEANTVVPKSEPSIKSTKPEPAKVAHAPSAKTTEQPQPKIDVTKADVSKSSKPNTSDLEMDLTLFKPFELPDISSPVSSSQPQEQSSIPKSGAKTTSSTTETVKIPEVKPLEVPDIPPVIKKGVEKASNGPKTLKVVGILVAVGAAIAGAIYWMKNKNNNNNK